MWMKMMNGDCKQAPEGIVPGARMHTCAADFFVTLRVFKVRLASPWQLESDVYHAACLAVTVVQPCALSGCLICHLLCSSD
jgi:hypothetical protein